MAIPALQAFVGQVGPAGVQDGNTPAIRLGRSAELIDSPAHGRYYEPTYRGQMYNATAIGVTTTVGTATTYTGLVLSNTPGSGVNLVLNKVGFGTTIVWPAVAFIGLMAGYSGTAVTHTTPGKVYNSKFIAGAQGVGLVDTAATLPVTPIVTHVFGAGLTGAATTTPQDVNFLDIEGSLILPPGAFVALYTSAVSPTAGLSVSFSWEEVLA